MTYYQKLNNAKYLSLTDASSGYHNLKLDKKSYLTMFACQLDGTDTNDYHLEQHQQVTCFNGKLMKYLKTCQMYLALKMIY